MTITADDRRRLLAGHFLLGKLPPERLDAVLTLARERHFPAGQVIFQKGDPGTGLMAVLSGRVKISVHSEDGKEVILNLIDQGQVFGEIALLDGRPRTAEATAMTDTAVLAIDRRDFIPFLEKEPQLATQLLVLLCQRLRRTSEMVENALLLDLPTRLARTLLHLARSYGVKTPRGLRLDIKLSQSDLGNLIGMTRESVNKQIKNWERDGILALEDGRIVILRMDELALIVEDVV